MAEGYRTVYRGGQGEITEKKSRFIATVRPVSSEEEASAFVDEMKKKYWDARHNCHAFTVGFHRECTRTSDDGEPSGTAGRPMLDVLLGEGLYDTAVVVTRYFGGVLLGTGGLVRAYSQAVQEGLKNSLIIEKKEGIRCRIDTDYPGFGKIQYLAGERGIPILDTIYTDRVAMELLLPKESEGSFIKAVTEATSARALITKEKDLRYAMIEGRAEIFDD